ncbi:aminopeptidase [Halobacteriales archaeon SW_7_71_33]|nr:MAG: aminopeptidase [Halobacteriales archaeon SW_7_71_33]
MDPRVREHAETVVDHSVDVEAGDEVIVRAPPVAEDLVVALHEAIGERGARPTYLANSDRVGRAYMRAIDADAIDLPEATLAAVEAADAAVWVRAARNTHEAGDVDPEKNSAMSQAQQPITETMMSKRTVITQYPAPGNAQDAEMSTEAYENFVYDAVNRDWDAQRAFQQQTVDLLDPAEEVRIVSGEETDLRLSVDGMVAANDHAERNLPGGEVYTAPVPDSVEGEVLFDMPLVTQGREIEDAFLRFENGEVVTHSAAKNEDVLTALLETDDGARRLGELGIGMNRAIDRFTYNMLFDEKMGDTVHLALGRAYEWTVGSDREQNESAVHQDVIVDMSEDSRIELDGEVVQRDGTFAFEDGFE